MVYSSAGTDCQLDVRHAPSEGRTDAETSHGELVGGLEPWNFLIFPSYWECHHPNWRVVSYFSEGWRKTTNQITWIGKDLEVQTWGPWQKRSVDKPWKQPSGDPCFVQIARDYQKNIRDSRANETTVPLNLRGVWSGRPGHSWTPPKDISDKCWRWWRLKMVEACQGLFGSSQSVSYCSWVISASNLALLLLWKHHRLAMDCTEHMNR